MREAVKMVAGLVGHEWRVLRRSPVGMIGLIAAMWFMLSQSEARGGWPTGNMALYGLQLTSSVLLGLIAFLLAAGTVARDLEDVPGQLLFSRPVPVGIYVMGKYLGAVTFMLALLGFLLALSLLRPAFHGVWVLYPLEPFLLALGLCMIPMVLYACAMAIFLVAVSRRVLVAFPLFLLYAVWAAVPTFDPHQVAMKDFTMRLYEHGMSLEVPVWLEDVSYAGVLNPVHPGLPTRALLYIAVSGVLLAGASWVLAKRRESKWIPVRRPLARWWTPRRRRPAAATRGLVEPETRS
jgi:hypothetical protein